MNVYTDKSSTLIHESAYPAANGVALHRGQVVVLTANAVSPAAATQAGAILGICLDNLDSAHAADACVRVADSPTTVYLCDAPEITASAGTTGTVSASALAVFADDAFNGGALRFISPGTSSTIGAAPGEVIPIGDYAGTGKTFTLGRTLSGAAAVGDVFQVFPPIGSTLGVLNTARDGVVLTSCASGFALRVAGWDTKAGKLLLMADKHHFGSKNA